ncbi:hypothetical protein [Leptospira ilyithenensis]|uniref:TIGR03067 domain-containing protein n=1 Tax=Leptospira ilyithenensis TaxID=2484901 RepID=A0A4R9LK19_9LEPT|nr:hypothetical protein [Leptospira ilyithenensis]TGN07926.1 hypothetical protein EHS11_13360 [Leptospira ilyithenensis]
MNRIYLSAFSSKYSLLIFFILLIGFQNCSEKSRVADTPPDLSSLPDFSGKWQLEGDGNIVVIDIDKEAKTASFGEVKLILEMDSLGVRLRPEDRENAIGYFLYSEIKDKTWIGTWDDRVVRLIRL